MLAVMKLCLSPRDRIIGQWHPRPPTQQTHVPPTELNGRRFFDSTADGCGFLNGNNIHNYRSSQLHSLTDPGRNTWSVVIFRFNIRYVRSYVVTCISTSERQVRFIFKVLKICFFWFAEPHSLQSSVEEFLFYNFWYRACHNTQPAE